MTYGDPKIMIPAFQSVILCSKYQSERKKCLECLINLVTYEPNSVLFISSLMHDPDE